MIHKAGVLDMERTLAAWHHRLSGSLVGVV